ncbi:hypothetical protein L3Q82_019484, partial [Scortum barcoo]
MFHRFHVKKEDQDYLRFLWWENGNLQAKPSIYRMRVHLFGVASSPGCANFGLKHLAAQGQGQFSDDAVHFIQRNFYVDDGLASVQTEKEAIKLIKESRELCYTGKLRLHKYVSNSENVMSTIPEEERAAVKDQDMALSSPHMERALGVERAIHMEMLDDMTTDAFINALRVFIAIRGNVRQLRCDQGTNFIGARREFTKLMDGMDQERIKSLGCEFLTNPPAASHMGGVWERQ